LSLPPCLLLQAGDDDDDGSEEEAGEAEAEEEEEEEVEKAERIARERSVMTLAMSPVSSRSSEVASAPESIALVGVRRMA